MIKYFCPKCVTPTYCPNCNAIQISHAHVKTLLGERHLFRFACGTTVKYEGHGGAFAPEWKVTCKKKENIE